MAHERFCCCCGFIENEPCGFPQGTIRSTLAIIITSVCLVGIIATVVLLLVYEQWTAAVAVSEAVLGVLGTVVGFYFGKRSRDPTPEQIIETTLLTE